jgi:hypothetical protein
VIDKTEAKEMIRAVFEEAALVLGGLVAVHEVEDGLVWRLVRNFDVIRERALRRLDEHESTEEEQPPAGGPAAQPHPAIQEFLARIRKG